MEVTSWSDGAVARSWSAEEVGSWSCRCWGPWFDNLSWLDLPVDEQDAEVGEVAEVDCQLPLSPFDSHTFGDDASLGCTVAESPSPFLLARSASFLAAAASGRCSPAAASAPLWTVAAVEQWSSLALKPGWQSERGRYPPRAS